MYIGDSRGQLPRDPSPKRNQPEWDYPVQERMLRHTLSIDSTMELLYNTLQGSEKDMERRSSAAAGGGRANRPTAGAAALGASVDGGTRQREGVSKKAEDLAGSPLSVLGTLSGFEVKSPKARRRDSVFFASNILLKRERD